MNLDDLYPKLLQTYPSGAATGYLDVGQLGLDALPELFQSLALANRIDLASDSGWIKTTDSLTLTGQTITDPLLGLSQGTAITIRFTPNGQEIALLLELLLPDSWRIRTTLNRFAGTLLDQVALASSPAQPACLLVASGSPTDPQRMAPDNTPLEVPDGLFFYGYFDLASPVFNYLNWFMPTGSPPVAFGQLQPWNNQQTLVDILLCQAQLPSLFGGDSITLPLAISLYGRLDPTLRAIQAGVQISSEINFSSQNINLSCLITAIPVGVLHLGITTSLVLPSPTELARWFGQDNGIIDNLPTQFQSPHSVEVTGIQFGIGLQTRTLEYATLTLGTPHDQFLTLIPNLVEVGNLFFNMTIFKPFDSTARSFSFRFGGIITLGGIPIAVTAQLPGLMVFGRLGSEDPVSLTPLLHKVFGYTTCVPSDLVISELEFTLDTQAQQYSFKLTLEGIWTVDFGVNNTLVFQELALTMSYQAAVGDQPSSASGSVTGIFDLGENQFNIEVAITDGDPVFTLSWQTSDDNTLNFLDLAVLAGMQIAPSPPSSLDLGLRSATLMLDMGHLTLACSADSVNYGQAIFVAGKSTLGQWGFIFALQIDLQAQLDLSTIPAVGQLIGGDQAVAIKGLSILAANSDLPDLTNLTPDQKALLGDEVCSGLTLATHLTVGAWIDQDVSVTFGGKKPAPEPTPTPTPQPDAQAVTATPAKGTPATAADAPSIRYIKIERSIGPLLIHRVGFEVSNSENLTVYLDAALNFTALAIGVTGLSATVSLHDITAMPSFDFQGLAISFKSDAVTLAGGLLKSQTDQGDPEFTGQLVVTLKTFSLSAFGSYATVNGSPSMFAYLVLDYPLGGPPCFFITGLAGGFGYNRSLQLPTIDTVAQYPLVAGALGTLKPDEIIPQLNTYIAPDQGEYWLAAGISFTSFEVLRSFALLTVAFGNHTQVALMGYSSLSMPPNVSEPLAQVQMVLEAVFDPTDGLFSFQAQLTDASYILSKDCKLTGGFATFFWFDPNPHAGDFVITLGGYHSQFKAPDYYPKVPRVGFNWQVVPDMLSMKGEIYFALTPSAAMAGGSMSAVWHTGPVRAWFDMHMDMLLIWKPFHYDFSVGIDLGAEVRVDLAFTTVSIRISLGADLDIWGPDFSGKAKIEVYIVSFTIHFGAGSKQHPDPLTYTEFAQDFIPGTTASAQLEDSAAKQNLACTLRVVNGMLQDFTQTNTGSPANPYPGLDWVVDPHACQLQAWVAVPLTSITFGDEQTTLDVDVAIGPMKLPAGQFTSRLDITFTGPDQKFQITPQPGPAPKAIWSNDPPGLDGSHAVITQVQYVLITPLHEDPDYTLPIPVASLLFHTDPRLVPWQWSAPAAIPASTWDQSQAFDQLAQITQPGVSATRAAILGSLATAGLPVRTTVDLDAMAGSARDFLQAPPFLCSLGEPRAQAA